MKIVRLRIAISAVSLALVALHLAFPNVTLDGPTVVLLVLAFLPWLAPVFKSIELPGGFKIELADVKSASDKIVASEEKEPPPSKAKPSDAEAPDGPKISRFVKSPTESLERMTLDPSLALVSLRIEIEKHLRDIAVMVGMEVEGKGLQHILMSLQREGFIPQSLAKGVSELVQLGNRAAHGEEVANAASEWALAESPAILRAMYAYPRGLEVFYPYDGSKLNAPALHPEVAPFSELVSSGRNKHGRWFVTKRNPDSGESILLLFQDPEGNSEQGSGGNA